MAMEMRRWLHWQGQRRRFFILWAIFAVLLLGIQITGSLIGAAWHHDHVLHAPPLWVFPSDVLSAGTLAAFLSRSRTGRAAN